MPTILITGAASGIGAAFLHHYASDPTNTIIAVDRAPIALPEPAPAAKVTSHTLDLTSEADIISLVSTTGLATTPLDIVLHSAGIRGLEPTLHAANPHDVASADSLSAMTPKTMLLTYHINVIGTLTLLRALLPGLRLAASTSLPKVIVMGSRMGSIGYNSTGGGYAYRASKAALNAVVKSLSIDVPEVVFLSVHPGRVETGLVLAREEGAISVAESVGNMLTLLSNVGRADSGRFVDRWGVDIGW